MAMWFFTTMTPAVRIESYFLVAALAVCGVKLPDRKTLMEEHLDNCYDFYQAAFQKELSLYNESFQIATDGWTKKAVEKALQN